MSGRHIVQIFNIDGNLLKEKEFSDKIYVDFSMYSKGIFYYHIDYIFL